MLPQKNILLSTAYFGPVQYYTKFLACDQVYIEQFENFIKQTWRNRCRIMGGSGPVMLIIPVVKGRGPKILIRDIKISYDTDWQRNHWRTLFSAFNSSPYFQYYCDEIKPFFEKKYTFLLDLNMEIHYTLSEILELNQTPVLTGDFEKVPQLTLNLREFFTPKMHKTLPDKHFSSVEYTQVFSEKFGFVPNLSILDLIFNEGPNSFNVLEKCILNI